jgi:hypothetical protein
MYDCAHSQAAGQNAPFVVTSTRQERVTPNDVKIVSTHVQSRAEDAPFSS